MQYSSADSTGKAGQLTSQDIALYGETVEEQLAYLLTEDPLLKELKLSKVIREGNVGAFLPEAIRRIPFDKSGWDHGDATGVTPMIALCQSEQFSLLPEDVRAAIPAPLLLRMVGSFSSPIRWLMRSGHIKSLPYEALANIPMNEQGWFHRVGDGSSLVDCAVMYARVPYVMDVDFLSRYPCIELQKLWQCLGTMADSSRPGLDFHSEGNQRIFQRAMQMSALKAKRRQKIVALDQ